MKLRFFLCILFSLGILCGCSTSNEPKKNPAGDYFVAAYIWPSCHDDPLGRANLWPEGIGEWEVIKKGNPRYEGHYQPKQPLWGYEMDNDPKVVEKWINAATDHGINVFIYDWYWYDEGPFLESALNDGFLKAKNNEKMYFYVMWANHDVPKNYWNYHLHGDDESILWDAAVDWKNYQIIVERVIRQYFHKPNYFKIDGQPVFAIFSHGKLMQSFGRSVEETRKGLEYFREEARKAGFPGVHFQLIAGDYMNAAFAKQIETLGFNSVTPYHMATCWKKECEEADYLAYGKRSRQVWEQNDEILNIPFFPNVAVGWDDTPRFPKWTGDYTIHHNNSPESFAALLSKAKQFVDNQPNRPKMITINAWNEWVEGSYLLPDMKYGFGYLEAVKKVMEGKYDRYK